MVSTSGVIVYDLDHDCRLQNIFSVAGRTALEAAAQLDNNGRRWRCGCIGHRNQSALGMSPRLGEGTQNRNEQNELNQALSARRRRRSSRRRRNISRRRSSRSSRNISRRQAPPTKSPTPPPVPTLLVQLIARNEFGLIGPNALVFGGSTMNVYTIRGCDVTSIKLNLGIKCTQNEWMSSELDGWNDLKNMALGTAVPIVAMLKPGGTAESCRNVTEGKVGR